MASQFTFQGFGVLKGLGFRGVGFRVGVPIVSVAVPRFGFTSSKPGILNGIRPNRNYSMNMTAEETSLLPRALQRPIKDLPTPAAANPQSL